MKLEGLSLEQLKELEALVKKAVKKKLNELPKPQQEFRKAFLEDRAAGLSGCYPCPGLDTEEIQELFEQDRELRKWVDWKQYEYYQLDECTNSAELFRPFFLTNWLEGFTYEINKVLYEDKEKFKALLLNSLIDPLKPWDNYEGGFSFFKVRDFFRDKSLMAEVDFKAIPWKELNAYLEDNLSSETDEFAEVANQEAFSYVIDRIIGVWSYGEGWGEQYLELKKAATKWIEAKAKHAEALGEEAEESEDKLEDEVDDCDDLIADLTEQLEDCEDEEERAELKEELRLFKDCKEAAEASLNELNARDKKLLKLYERVDELEVELIKFVRWELGSDKQVFVAYLLADKAHDFSSVLELLKEYFDLVNV